MADKRRVPIDLASDLDEILREVVEKIGAIDFSVQTEHGEVGIKIKQQARNGVEKT